MSYQRQSPRCCSIGPFRQLQLAAHFPSTRPVNNHRPDVRFIHPVHVVKLIEPLPHDKTHLRPLDYPSGLGRQFWESS
ncbi:hypothetical protein L1887_36752 [Cichorium endivia]|nr:hypothetical protein L1887_36752 [Cichorium endivia]